MSRGQAAALVGLLLAAFTVGSAAAAGRTAVHRCTGADAGTYRQVVVMNADNCSFTGSARTVVVQAGGTLTLTGAHVSHNLLATQASAVTVGSNSHVDHDAIVSGTAGSVNVSGSTIGHNAVFRGNHALVLSGDTIGHDAVLDGNGSAQLSTTKVGHDGSCAGTVTGSGNTYGHRHPGCP